MYLNLLYNKMLFVLIRCGLKKEKLYVKFTIKTKNEFNS